MRKSPGIFRLLILLFCVTSCQWILTHPVEDAEAVQWIEQGAEELYQYETGKSFPLMPVQPPMLPGADGPKTPNPTIKPKVAV